MHQIAASALAVMMVTACASVARAQNHRSVPLGGRTATMGGAGVASGVDAAMPYLNPAGIAGTPYDIFSVSADVYSYRTASIPSYFRPTGLNPKFGNDLNVTQESYSQVEVLTVPSGLSYFKRIGSDDDPVMHVLAVSLMAIASADQDTQGQFRAQGSMARIQVDQIGTATSFEYVGGPSYAIRVGKDFRAGISVFGALARLKPDSQILLSISQIQNGVETPNTANQRTTVDAFSIGLTAVAGAQARLYDKLWGGVAVEAPTIPIHGWGDVGVYQDQAFVDPMKGQITSHSVAHGSFTRWQIAQPLRLSGGLSYEHPSFALALDGHVYFARSDFGKGSVSADTTQLVTGMPATQGTQSIDLNFGTVTTFDMSAGAEVHVSKDVAIRGGFLSDLDPGEPSSNGQKNSRLDWYVATLGLGVKDGTFESTYGIGLRCGNGTEFVQDYLGANPNRVVGVSYHAYGAMLMLSGGVRTSSDDKK